MVVEIPLRRGYTRLQNRWNGGLNTQHLSILRNQHQLAGTFPDALGSSSELFDGTTEGVIQPRKFSSRTDGPRDNCKGQDKKVRHTNRVREIRMHERAM